MQEDHAARDRLRGRLRHHAPALHDAAVAALTPEQRDEADVIVAARKKVADELGPRQRGGQRSLEHRAGQVGLGFLYDLIYRYESSAGTHPTLFAVDLLMSPRASLAIAPEPAGTTGPVRVATYSRISTDEERQPNSLQAQRVRLDSFVSSQPEWCIGRHYEDQFTGTVIDRPALTRLLRDAKRDRFDVLLVYRVDRLARSIRGLAQIIDELDQAGVIFRSATEPFDTGTPAGRMMVQMLGVFAEFERALIVERITAGLERKAARGGWCGGQRPYGLSIASDRDHLERNPTEAPLVPVIFDQYANRQFGSSALATWLNEQGYRTKNGRLWSAGTVITVLRNRAYIGEIYYRGNWYPAPHDPLITKELSRRRRRSSPSAAKTARDDGRTQRSTC